MRVVILHPALYLQVSGGAEVQIAYLASYLLKNRHEVHFIYEEKGIEITESTGFILHPVRKINIPGGLGKRWILYGRKIIFELTQIKPEVIYTRFASSWAGFASLYSRKYSVRHVHSIASDTEFSLKISFSLLMRPLSVLDWWYYKNALKYANKILVQNAYQGLTLQKKYKRMGILINQMTQEVDESLLCKGERIQILWIGNLKGVKCPELFIELVHRLNYLEDKIKMIMIGRPSPKYLDMIALAERTYSYFQYLGELTHNKLYRIMNQSHLLINTSVNEGFSNTFVEAWMRKIPVLSMNANPNNVITDNEIGYITKTIEELSGKIDLLITNRDLIDLMGQRAFSYAIQNHAINKVMPKVLDILISD